MFFIIKLAPTFISNIQRRFAIAPITGALAIIKISGQSQSCTKRGWASNHIDLLSAGPSLMRNNSPELSRTYPGESSARPFDVFSGYGCYCALSAGKQY